jgi:hypothetical protein
MDWYINATNPFALVIVYHVSLLGKNGTKMPQKQGLLPASPGSFNAAGEIAREQSAPRGQAGYGRGLTMTG